MSLPADLALDDAQAAADRSGWQKPWVQLIWLGFLLIPLQWRTPSLVWQTALAVAVFLAIFFWAFEKTGPVLWLARVLVFIVGVALFPYNSFAHTFFIYAGMPSMRGKSVESIAIAVCALIATYVYVQWAHLDGLYVGIVGTILSGTAIAILWSRAEVSARLNEVSRAALLGKDIEIAHLAKIAERDRIARDLHDLLGHTLSLIALKAELAQKLALQEGPRAAVEMQEVALVARTALSEVRQTIAGMRGIGLADALTAVNSMLRTAGIEVDHQIEATPEMSSTQEHALAQALLEAVTNIVRHAHARHVTILIARRAEGLTLQIDDDGRGGGIRPGNGLKGMQERLAAVSGSLAFSELRPGVRVTATVPL